MTGDSAALVSPAPRPDLELRFRPPLPVDLGLTLGPLCHGGGDPSMRVGRTWAARAWRTPSGPVALELRALGGEIVVRAWGPGSAWAGARAAALCGAEDDDSGFAPADPLVRDLRLRYAGLRLCRTEAVVDACVSAVVRQRWTTVEAHRAWGSLVRELGGPAPGPVGLRLPPVPATLAATPGWRFHIAGIEQGRAATLRRIGAVATRLEECTAMPIPEARRRLLGVTGIGPWSAAEVTLAALGDPDAVPLGDVHLPHMVAWALAREPRGSDARMLELLAPYAGHRARVLRLLLRAGIREPRRGPRRPIPRRW